MDTEVTPPDWEAIEQDYRAGVLTSNQVAEKYGITRGQLMGRAYREGWKKDLGPRIAARRETKLAEAAAPTLGLPVPREGDTIGDRAAAERETIDTAAELQARVTLKHRKSLTKTANLCEGLIEELTVSSLSREDIANVVELVAIAQGQRSESEYDQAALNKKMDSWVKLLSLENRTDVLKKLVDSMQKLVLLERLVYGIDARGGKFPPEGSGEDETKAVEYTPNDVARRLAFVFATGLRDNKE